MLHAVWVRRRVLLLFLLPLRQLQAALCTCAPARPPAPAGKGSLTTAQELPGGHLFEDISAGARHFCGRTQQGEAWCWDGAAAAAGSARPVQVSSGMRWQQVSAGGTHSCGVQLGTGRGFCWGDGGAGQLGTGRPQVAAAPVPVAGGHTWSHISAGHGSYSCGIDGQGAALCWVGAEVGGTPMGRGAGVLLADSTCLC